MCASSNQKVYFEVNSNITYTSMVICNRKSGNIFPLEYIAILIVFDLNFSFEGISIIKDT